MAFHNFSTVNTWDGIPPPPPPPPPLNHYSITGAVPITLGLSISVQEAIWVQHYNIPGDVTMPTLALDMSVREVAWAHGDVTMPTLALEMSERTLKPPIGNAAQRLFNVRVLRSAWDT